jgi:hypothetical protein
MLNRILALALALSAMPACAQVPPPEGWVLKGNTIDGPKCRAVKLDDATVDIQLLRNYQDKIVISAGHPDWNLPSSSTPVPVTLAVDGASPVALSGYPIAKIVLVVIQDAALEKSVRDAHTLKWHFAWGDFVADVSGLGDAFSLIGVCPN